MTEFTPAQLKAWAGLGPWCQPDGPEYGVMLDRVPSRLIHGFLGQPIFDKQPHDDWFEQEMANAALIAAAPDLARLVLEKDRLLEFIFCWLSPDQEISDAEILSVLRNHPTIRQAMKEASDE